MLFFGFRFSSLISYIALKHYIKGFENLFLTESGLYIVQLAFALNLRNF